MLEAERRVGIHAARRRPRTPVQAVLLTLLALGVACAGGEEAGEPALADTAEAAGPEVAAEDGRQAVVRPVALAREPRVPHAPHRALACVSCHQTIPGHAIHGELRCSECHPVPARYAAIPLPSETECQECHHGGALADRCTNCHERSKLVGPVRVTALMQVANWERPRNRELPFDHAWHGSLACTACHSESASRAPEVECRTCHEQHHQLDANCRQCHSAISQSVHTEAAHRGCGGSGCHQDAIVSAFPPLRSVCLVCHQNMVDHNAPRECAICHAIPETWRGAPTPPGPEP